MNLIFDRHELISMKSYEKQRPLPITEVSLYRPASETCGVRMSLSFISVESAIFSPQTEILWDSLN